MKSKNIFKNIPQNLEDELFEDIIKSDAFTLERIISDGQSSPKEGWHESNQNEWVIVLQGEAILELESGKKENLKRGDYYHIDAKTKHKVLYTSLSEKTIWLALHY